MATKTKARAKVAEPRRVLRQVPQSELRKALLTSMVVAPIQALELERRVPEFCRKRGWHPHPPDVAKGGTGFEWIAVAVGAYRIGARGQRLTIPPAFLEHERWKMFARQFGVRPTAEEIVEAMEMDELLGEEAKHELVEA